MMQIGTLTGDGKLSDGGFCDDDSDLLKLRRHYAVVVNPPHTPKSSRSDGEKVHLLREEVERLLLLGLYDDALASVMDLVPECGESDLVQHIIGVVQTYRGDLVNAKVVLEHVLAEREAGSDRESRVSTFMALALVEMRHGGSDRAWELMDEASLLDPRSFHVSVNRYHLAMIDESRSECARAKERFVVAREVISDVSPEVASGAPPFLPFISSLK